MPVQGLPWGGGRRGRISGARRPNFGRLVLKNLAYDPREISDFGPIAATKVECKTFSDLVDFSKIGNPWDIRQIQKSSKPFFGSQQLLQNKRLFAGSKVHCRGYSRRRANMWLYFFKIRHTFDKIALFDSVPKNRRMIIFSQLHV